MERPNAYQRRMVLLAHLSDPHLAPMPRPRLTELASKRLLGFVNWHLRRKTCHRRDVLDALVADLSAAAPDHIALTGDLINIALEEEFAPARAWLDVVGPPDRVTFVPGNHDIYVRGTAHSAERHWGDYMRADDAATGPTHFPFVRRRGPVALIGLSTGVPTLPFEASGWLGAAQIARLAELLPQLAGMFRIVLIHHPPLGRRPWHKRLKDAAPLLRVLAAQGAELVLHGHDHRRMFDWVDAGSSRIPVVGVPSASAAPGSHHVDPAGYNLYRVEGERGGWRCEMTVRGWRHGAMVELERRTLIG